MNQCLVFFNGPSLNHYLSLPKRFTEIGCNYIESIRPSVDHIVCYDPEMRLKIPQTPGKRYWCKNGHRNATWGEICYEMIDTPQCSGTLAVRLALQLGFSTIWVLGCDWGHSDQSVFQDRYQSQSARKYSNSKVRQMDRWMRDRDIRIVSDNNLAFKKKPVSLAEFNAWIST